ncbi:MAG: hypothetical protein FJY75_03995 [Candidatus Eisenbacteria bacterium]|uniref:Tetratricopeptide repeat protein n=1 Tax=Eiseniibacteriota bacterium TaxID=2212470 RepID=A0A938BQ90_UNCEI|nr:hypothetical protein [Candidatus Eisenbacteria bacterium]
MRARGWTAPPLLAAAGVCALLAAAGLSALLAAQAAKRLEAASPPRGRPELAFFPSGRGLAEASLGHRHLLADLAWLTAIQYYGEHRRGDRRYPQAAHLFRVVTDADPGFSGAYLFGALILAENGEIDEAAALLAKGVRARPRDWRSWFELGFFHFAVTRSFDEAGSALRIAARLPGAEAYVPRFAAAAAQRAGDRDLALRLWETVARTSDNAEIRRMADEQRAALGAEQDAG